jgi:hypothetical protein
MHREFDQPIRQAACAGPLVADPGAGTEWCEGDTQRRPADRVEQPADHHPTVLAAAQLETPGLDRADVLGEHPGGIGCMARVGAVEREAADRVLDGELEERALVEPRLTSRALDRAGSAGEQREVGEPDPPLAERGDTRREAVGLLPGRDRAGGGIAGHPALVADPVDRRRRTLGRMFISGREGRGLASEAKFEQIDAATEPDQAFAELERRELTGWQCHEPLDTLEEPLQSRGPVFAITHRCIIEQMFVGPARRTVRRPPGAQLLHRRHCPQWR